MVHYDKSSYTKVDNVGKAFNGNFGGVAYIEGIGMYGEHIELDGCGYEAGGIVDSLFLDYFRTNFDPLVYY